MCANLSATWNGVRIRKLKLKWKKHKIYLRWWWKIYFNDFVFINIHNWKKDVHFIAIWSALRFIFVGADDQSFLWKITLGNFTFWYQSRRLRARRFWTDVRLKDIFRKYQREIFWIRLKTLNMNLLCLNPLEAYQWLTEINFVVSLLKI